MVCFSKTNQTIKHSRCFCWLSLPRALPFQEAVLKRQALRNSNSCAQGIPKWRFPFLFVTKLGKKVLFKMPTWDSCNRPPIYSNIGRAPCCRFPQLSSWRSFVLSWSYSLFLVLDLHGCRAMFTCSPLCCWVMFAACGTVTYVDAYHHGTQERPSSDKHDLLIFYWAMLVRFCWL